MHSDAVRALARLFAAVGEHCGILALPRSGPAANGYSERIFIYRKKSGKSIKAAMRLPTTNIPSTTIPKIAIACITVKPHLALRRLKSRPLSNSGASTRQVTDHREDENNQKNQT